MNERERLAYLKRIEGEAHVNAAAIRASEKAEAEERKKLAAQGYTAGLFGNRGINTVRAYSAEDVSGGGRQ